MSQAGDALLHLRNPGDITTTIKNKVLKLCSTVSLPTLPQKNSTNCLALHDENVLNNIDGFRMSAFHDIQTVTGSRNKIPLLTPYKPIQEEPEDSCATTGVFNNGTTTMGIQFRQERILLHTTLVDRTKPFLSSI